MIDAPQVVNGVVSGVALMVVALVPGLFQNMVDGVRRIEGVLGMRAGFAVRDGEPVGQPQWLAGVGAALIVFSVCAYLS
jgi:hypothetical protein